MALRWRWLRATTVLALVAAMVAVAPASAQEPPTEAPDAPNDIVDGAVVAAAADGPVRVVIALDDPPAGARVNPEDWIDGVQSDVRDELGPRFETHIDFVEIPALVGTVTSPDALIELAAIPGVRRVDLDVDGGAFLADVVPFIGADDFHTAGITGNGVTVAVLDSGIDAAHTDLSSSAIGGACFGDNDGTIDGAGFCPAGSDRETGAASAAEGNGHGSHVSGIITSDGTVASVGVAPDADVVPIKVLDNAGFFYFFSEIVAGLEYISLHPELGVDVVSMSLGTNARFTGACDSETAWTIAGAAAVALLTADDITVIAATGNAAQSSEMSAPACLSDVLAVGALNKDGTIASYGNRGTELDVMAPGTSVVSVDAGGTTTTKTGTSMATPAVAGCAALLLEAGTAPANISAALTASSTTVTDTPTGAIYPVLECVIPVTTCDGQTPTHLGTGVAETLTGTAGPDVFLALGGNDTIVGNGGDDIVCGGDGDDIITLGSGADRVFGDAGDDDIRTFGGDDYVEGGDDDDVIRSGSGADEVHAGNGVDTVIAGNGADLVFGDAGADNLNGGANVDTIDGGEGDDAVRGQGGNDILDGSAGMEIIRGHAGDDTLRGGDDADILLGSVGHDHLFGDAGDDTLWAGVGADALDGGDGVADFCHGGSDSDVDTDVNCEIRNKLP